MQIIRTMFSCFFLMFASITSFATQLPNVIYSKGYVPVDHGKLFYQSFGKGIPIIVVHGGPGMDQTILQPQLYQLIYNYRVIFYDQRGSGKSLHTSMDARYINSKQFVKDLEALRKYLGLKQFILLGHSWGGMLGMAYAIKHPHRVAALILSNTGPANLKGYFEFAANVAKKIEPFKDKVAPLFDTNKFDKLNLSQIKELYKLLLTVYFYDSSKVDQVNLGMTEKSAKSGKRVEAILTLELLKGFDLLPKLKHLNMPTLLIHGDVDVVPLSIAKEIKESMPQAELLTLGNCGHFPYVEQPTQFFESIKYFINDVSRQMIKKSNLENN